MVQVFLQLTLSGLNSRQLVGLRIVYVLPLVLRNFNAAHFVCIATLIHRFGLAVFSWFKHIPEDETTCAEPYPNIRSLCSPHNKSEVTLRLGPVADHVGMYYTTTYRAVTMALLNVSEQPFSRLRSPSKTVPEAHIVKLLSMSS